MFRSVSHSFCISDRKSWRVYHGTCALNLSVDLLIPDEEKQFIKRDQNDRKTIFGLYSLKGTLPPH